MFSQNISKQYGIKNIQKESGNFKYKNDYQLIDKNKELKSKRGQ